MSKRSIGMWTAVLVILAIAAVSLPVLGSVRAARENEQTVQQIREQLEGLEEASVRKQLNLAKWYNLNQTKKEPEAGSREAYGQILAFTDGAMGYLEIPQLGLSVPICHGTGEHALETGAGHLEGSSLPIGGLGNHAVLVGQGGESLRADFGKLGELSEGDLVYIYIPGGGLVYVVDSVTTIAQPRVAGFAVQEGQDLLTLVAEAYVIKTVVRCSRAEEALEREALSAIRETPVVDKDLLAAALCGAIAAGLLPLAVGCIGKAAGRRRNMRRYSPEP